jgi:hypothetical protein
MFKVIINPDKDLPATRRLSGFEIGTVMDKPIPNRAES